MFETPVGDAPRGTGPPSRHEPAPPIRVPVQDVHLLDRLGVVVRHRRLIAAVFIATVAVMMAQTYSTIPLYRAKAQILIQDERSTAVTALRGDGPGLLAGS
jgi:uncharacterized protein involved in exopolysaccharide biosynthesis